MFGEDAVKRSKGLKEAHEEFAETAGIYFMDAAAYAKASAKDGLHMEAKDHEQLGRALAQKIRSEVERSTKNE